MFQWKNLLLITIVFLALDFSYLGLTSSYFSQQIASVQRVAIQPRYLGALLCYILLILGLNHFIIKDKKSILEAFLLGVVIYGVYDTTNYATLKAWKMQTVIMDTLWGGILFAATTFLVYKLQKLF